MICQALPYNRASADPVSRLVHKGYQTPDLPHSVVCCMSGNPTSLYQTWYYLLSKQTVWQIAVLIYLLSRP